MHYKERVVHGTIQSEHIVQFFDTAESLADAVADFVSEGYGLGETLLLAITPAHWVLVAAILERRGVRSPPRWPAASSRSSTRARCSTSSCATSGRSLSCSTRRSAISCGV